MNLLLVGGSYSVQDAIRSELPSTEYRMIQHVDTCAQADSYIASHAIDLILIIPPVGDRSSIRFATDLADDNYGVLLLVSPAEHEQIRQQVSEHGVMTLTRPVSRTNLMSHIESLCAYRCKVHRMEAEQKVLQERMSAIRTVNHAKWLLIEHLHMNENDAHHFIEKKAMDQRLSRREAAEAIIHQYV